MSSPADTDIEGRASSIPSVPPPLLATPIPNTLKSAISALATKCIALPADPDIERSNTPCKLRAYVNTGGYEQEPSSTFASAL